MEKQNLTGYSDSELNLWVQNDESLYKEFMRQVDRASYKNPDECFEELIDILSEYFIFNQGQIDNLRESFEAELQELINDNES